jgi:hypothetical protein
MFNFEMQTSRFISVILIFSTVGQSRDVGQSKNKFFVRCARNWVIAWEIQTQEEQCQEEGSKINLSRIVRFSRMRKYDVSKGNPHSTFVDIIIDMCLARI